MRTKFELADAVRLFGAGPGCQSQTNPAAKKGARENSQCRTAALGGHEEVCDSCGAVRYSYNSCGDRHCPKCQASKQAFWIDDLMRGTLPVKHYHVIFTVPHHLNQVCLHNQRMYYDLLFASVWHTLRSFGYSHYGVESGPWLFFTPGDRTFHCIRTFIVLFPLQDIPSTGGGRTSVIQGNTSIRCIN